MKNRIKELIEQIIRVCESWINKGEDGLNRFVDPNDNEEISAHYGATHTAAAFIIWGRQTDNDVLYNKGVSLLDSILKRWDKSKTLPAFHFDFNNLALCLAEGQVDDGMACRIRETVINTSDSNHDTINWLPMRWAVNKKRLEWTKNTKYNAFITQCKKTIAKATNADGGIEDRLPHGLSFNLQYDLATVAVMQYLRVHGEQVDLAKELGFLLNAVAPDGDINYQGRGTNQIFAWGLWIYLLASSSQAKELGKALDYLEHRLPKMLENNNMMLNEWDGKEKYLWWDYHYASVYTAHCLLWLVLAFVDFEKNSIMPVLPNSTETGLHILKNENVFVSWFEGRSEYLAEKGPAIACIWTRNSGIIFKGTFGPWQGLFGNKYIYEDIVLNNFFGLLEVKKNKDWHQNRIVRKFLPHYCSKGTIQKNPSFTIADVDVRHNCIIVKYNLDPSKSYLANLPLWGKCLPIFVFADNEVVTLSHVADYRFQYRFIHLLSSRTIDNTKKIIIKINNE